MYSLRTKYYTVTIPLVDRYAAMFMNGNRNASGDTVSKLLANIDCVGGPQGFADTVVKKPPKAGGKE